nr:lysine--tRNA ligase [Candidatus Omnitrophota bacterium]
MELEELIHQRKVKLESLRQLGINPYGTPLPGCAAIGSLIADFKEGAKVTITGRIMAKRSHGKAAFLDLRDTTAKIQLYVKASIVGEALFRVFELLEVADFIAVEGELFKTHTGEPTLKVEKCVVLTKALRPLPEKWHGLKDVESRFRQRYLDLISNEDVKKVFLLRSQIIRAVRASLDQKGYQEVETPMMHDIAG